jgi:quaternary ammonium compound-resistance protein SugE
MTGWMGPLSTSQAWVVLVLAGVLEAGWAIGLSLSAGFTRPLPSALTIAAIILSMWLLGIAARTLPIGTAYAVWVGIGASLAAVLGWRVLGEPMSLSRAGFLLLLLVAIIGLKVTSSPAPTAP